MTPRQTAAMAELASHLLIQVHQLVMQVEAEAAKLIQALAEQQPMVVVTEELQPVEAVPLVLLIAVVVVVAEPRAYQVIQMAVQVVRV